jgi:glycosyltransferase involved in cell wall biosynthesis
MKLSVLICAYNQEAYVEQAVRGALGQRTSFPFEIVIGEDASRDRTPEILKRLASENPDRIRLTINEKNFGMHGNYRATYDRCRGAYIALLEGDDYWIDERKLQKQVDFLDSSSECVLCFHDVLVFEEGGETEHLYCRPGLPQITGLVDILQDMYINTSSVVMRNGPRYPEWGTDLEIGDWPYYIYLATFGKFGFINEVMAAYRKHPEGKWNRASVQQRIAAVTKMYQYANDHLGGKYDAMIQVLVKRWTAYFELDGERREWKQRALDAEQKVEEMTRARRALKDQIAALTREIEQFRSRDGVAK